MRNTVSILLLTFITAVTAGFIIHPYITGLVDQMKNFNFYPTANPLTLEYAEINGTCILLHVSNPSVQNVQINSIYVNSEQYPLTSKIQILSKSSFTIQIPGSYLRGESYTVKLVSTQFEDAFFTVTYS